MAEKAIFKFENDVKLSAPGAASWTYNVNNINRIEHEKKGVHLDNDIYVKNGRITRFDNTFEKNLSNHAMSILWPKPSIPKCA